MLDSDDLHTRFAVRELERVVRAKRKPLILWLGAGVSAWAGLPLWHDLAEQVHREFRNLVPTYNVGKAQKLLQQPPALFDYCFELDAVRLRAIVIEVLARPAPGPVYERLVSLLGALPCSKLLTPNFDEILEHSLPPHVQIFQRTNLEAVLGRLHGDASFLVKLHGSLSAVEDLILTSSDYDRLVANPVYLQFLREVFSQAHLLFLGTSLRDEYVIDLLRSVDSDKKLFGDGPHFYVGRPSIALPNSVRVLRTASDSFDDHRSSLNALLLVKDQMSADRRDAADLLDGGSSAAPGSHVRTAYFVSDFIPAGTWTSSHTARVRSEASDVDDGEFVVGLGFVDEELGPDAVTAPLQDLLVGLVCFDVVVTPLDAVPRLHDLIGGDRFWRLIDAEALEFVYSSGEPVVVYGAGNFLSGGGLASIHLLSDERQPLTIEERIRRYLRPVPGKEATWNDTSNSSRIRPES